MPALVAALPRVHPIRRRKVHVKSRKGCGNCRLRRVKCDELRPHCKRCKAYGVACNYDRSDPAQLELAAQGSFMVELSSSYQQNEEHEIIFDFHSDATTKTTQAQQNADSNNFAPGSGFQGIITNANINIDLQSPISLNDSIASMIDASLHHDSSISDMQLPAGNMSGSAVPFWHFTSFHLDILSRFKARTCLTIGDPKIAPLYRDIVCQLALTNPFLLHMLLSLTLMHDSSLLHPTQHTLAQTTKRQSLTHWNTATALFHALLARPVCPVSQDPIWATGVIIGAASFWYMNSENAYEVWPLKPYEDDDLAWLKLGEGKKILWELSQPTRKGSVFCEIMKGKEIWCGKVPVDTDVDLTSVLSAQMCTVFGIDVSSCVENNVFFLPLLLLSRLQGMRLRYTNALDFLYVTAFTTPELMALLEVKEARAVFLLGWWFQMVAKGELWWMVSRARVEGPAVRIWLEREDRRYGLAAMLDGLVVEDD